MFRSSRVTKWILLSVLALASLAVGRAVFFYFSADQDSLSVSSREPGTTPQVTAPPQITAPPQTSAVPLSATTAPSADAPPTGNRPLVVHEDGYVGSQSCSECHAHQHDTWHASFHRTMTQVASPTSVVGEFNNVQLEYLKTRCRVYRQGEEFWVEIDDVRPGFTTTEPIKRQIVQTTGSHHVQAYWYPSGNSRTLSLFPFVFLIKERRWVPCEAAFLVHPQARFSIGGGRWNKTCSGCHTTGVKPGMRSTSELDTRVAEFGVSCEACHGPAEEHVALDVHTEDLKIVNPSKIAPKRSAEICGQCHSVFQFHTPEESRNRLVRGMRFRPGDILADTRLIVTREKFEHPQVRSVIEQMPIFVESHFWPDGMVRLSGREYNGLIESPCYQHDDETRTLTCLSCHNMHLSKDDSRPLDEWADDTLKPGMRSNLACVQCHTEYNDNQQLVRHTHHEADSSGSNCYNCHMPHTTYGLLKAIRSHTIDSPSVQSSLATGRPNACNACHLDQTLGWTAEYLESWFDIEQPEIPDDERTIAAAVLWALKGDAAQRALAAWSMGWPPAREASGHDWLTPYLAEFLTDNYHAVRFIAYRSLRLQPGFEDLEFDTLSDAADRVDKAIQIRKEWAQGAGEIGRANYEKILVDAQRKMNTKVVVRLLREQNRRVVFISE